MSGGILQLVAKGAQDVYLTNNPEITFFKLVYRRHTMFSKCELDVAFSGTPDFGSIIKSKLQKSGDLLHRLFLITKLPEIELIFKSLKIKEVVDILCDYDISWKPNKNKKLKLNKKFNKEDYEEVSKLIDIKIKELYKNIEDVNKIEKILKDCPEDEVEETLMKQDDNYLIYELLNKEINRTSTTDILTNSNKLKNKLCGKMYLDIDSPSVQNLKLLRKLNDRDSKDDIKDKYKNLDAYKIYKTLGTKVSDVNQGLLDNINCLKSVCDSLTTDLTFLFFKDEVSGLFVNNSSVKKNSIKYLNTCNKLSDTLKLKGIYGKFVNEEVEKFNKANSKMFKNLKLEKFEECERLDKISYETNIEVVTKLVEYLESENLVKDVYTSLIEELKEEKDKTTVILDKLICKSNILDNKQHAVIKLDQYIELDGLKLSIPEYIISNYLKVIKSKDIPTEIKEDLEKIVNIFKDDMWYNLMNGFIKNYNHLYKTIFDVEKCTNLVGIEMGFYIKYINSNFNTNSYYTADKSGIVVIKKYCENQISKWDNQFKVEKETSKLVDVDVPESIYLFEKMSVLDNYLKHTNFQSDKCGVLDIVEDMKSKILDLGLGDSCDIFNHIDNKYLYNILDNINLNYNGFSSKVDLFKFLKDLVVEQSYFGDDDNKNCNKKSVLDKFSKLKLKCETSLAKIDNSLDYCGLKSKLLRSVSCTEEDICSNNMAKFAWIQYVGHYIIDYVSVTIGDQEIERHTGEYLQLLHQQTKKDSKERGYNEMIGNVPELTDYNNSKKEERDLITPLKFWFSKYLSGSIPLVAMLHTEIEITVKYKELSEVAFFDKFTNFKSIPKLKSKLIGEYIYIGAEERERLVKSRLEYIIDQVEYNGDGVIIDDKSVNNKSNCDLDLEFREISSELSCDDLIVEERLYYENPCKEYIWVMQRLDFIDGSLPGGERLYHNYSFDLGERVNPAKEAKIQFSNRNREDFKFIDYYNYVEPDKHHYSTPSRGINSYSFALYPEQPQPSGAANLSLHDDTSLVVKMKEEVVRSMKKRGIKFRWGIYIHKINFLRIYSGMAGLTFFSGGSVGVIGDSDEDSCCKL